MADDKQKVQALLRALRELETDFRAKTDAIHAELDAVLGGGVSIGAKLTALESHFEGLWQGRYRGRYEWVKRAVSRGHMKKLLAAHDVEDIKSRMGLYFRAEDRFYVQARHAWGIFYSQFNTFAPANPAGGKLADVEETEDFLRRVREQ